MKVDGNVLSSTEVQEEYKVCTHFPKNVSSVANTIKLPLNSPWTICINTCGHC